MEINLASVLNRRCAYFEYFNRETIFFAFCLFHWTLPMTISKLKILYLVKYYLRTCQEKTRQTFLSIHFQLVNIFCISSMTVSLVKFAIKVIIIRNNWELILNNWNWIWNNLNVNTLRITDIDEWSIENSSKRTNTSDIYRRRKYIFF